MFTKSAITIGDNCIDNYLEPINKTFVGGSALNVSIALYRNGITDTSYIGVVGMDKHGDKIITTLQSEGINKKKKKKMVKLL